jgi:hypothetical protein
MVRVDDYKSCGEGCMLSPPLPAFVGKSFNLWFVFVFHFPIKR